VYVVRKESGEERKQTLHRNLLLPIGHLDGFQKFDTRPKPNPERQSRRNNQHQEPVEASDSDSDSESHTEVPVPPYRSQDIPYDVIAETESQEGIEAEVAQQVAAPVDTETEHQQPTADQMSQGDISQISDAEEDAPEEASLVGVEEEQRFRRSTRQKAQPSWMKSCDFVQSVQTSIPDPWSPKEKIQYLKSILITGSGKGYESKIIDTMLNLMKQ
jgi:hypothetical protein